MVKNFKIGLIFNSSLWNNGFASFLRWTFHLVHLPWSAPFSWVTDALRTSRFLPCEVRVIGSGCKQRDVKPAIPAPFGAAAFRRLLTAFAIWVFRKKSLAIACILRASDASLGLASKKGYTAMQKSMKKKCGHGNKDIVKKASGSVKPI